MNRWWYLLIGLGFVIGITLGSSTNVIGQSATIPSWVKNTALWWGQGQINDSEFIKAIQWLIDNNILSVPTAKVQNNSPSQSDSSLQKQNTGFSDTSCTMNEYGNVVHMTGHFTNGPNSYSFLSFTLGVIDANGKVVATGADNLYNVQPYETKLFDAQAVYSGTFSKCEIEIGYTEP